MISTRLDFDKNVTPEHRAIPFNSQTYPSQNLVISFCCIIYIMLNRISDKKEDTMK